MKYFETIMFNSQINLEFLYIGMKIMFLIMTDDDVLSVHFFHQMSNIHTKYVKEKKYFYHFPKTGGSMNFYLYIERKYIMNEHAMSCLIFSTRCKIEQIVDK